MEPINSPQFNQNEVLKNKTNLIDLLPDEILKNEILQKIFNEDLTSYAPISLVSKKWNQIVSLLLNIEDLSSMTKPSLSLNADSNTVMDTSGNLLAYFDSKHLSVLKTMTGYSSYTKLKSSFSLKTEFIKFVNNELYAVSPFKGLLRYDPNTASFITIAELNTGRRVKLLASTNNPHIAFTGETANSIKVYNTSTQKTIEIFDPITDEKAGRNCLGIALSANTLCVSYGGGKTSEIYFSVYNLQGQLLAKKMTPWTPEATQLDDKQIFVLFSNNEIKSYDIKTVAEKNNIILTEFDKNLTKFSQIKIQAHNNKLYAFSKHSVLIFNSDGSLFKKLDKDDKTLYTLKYAFSGNFMAIGLDQSIEVWNSKELVHTFPTYGSIIEEITFNTLPIPQLTVLSTKSHDRLGNTPTTKLEIWNPLLEVKAKARDIKALRTAEKAKVAHEARIARIAEAKVAEAKAAEEAKAKASQGIASKIVSSVSNYFWPSKK